MAGERDIKIDLVKKDGKIITYRGSLHEMRRICHIDMHIYNSSKRKWLQR